jgi:site-specific DNA-adenine methylase
MSDKLKAPFPWFGGKSRVANLVWRRFGDPVNYVEPFFGSGAVLLGRPHEPRTETVNDLDCYVANFWRAVQADPRAVALHADWPVNEADLHARHLWLAARAKFREHVRRRAHWHDAKVAGWWVWGVSQWIGGGWCQNPGWAGRSNAGRASRGIQAVAKRPNLKRGGVGVHRTNRGRNGSASWEQRPSLTKRGGVGVNSDRVVAGILEYMELLAERLRRVRVCCGDWRRVLGPSPTVAIGTTAVFLDPPYDRRERDNGIYGHDAHGLARDVAKWARERGADRAMRVALCGLQGEHQMPGWTEVAWRATGGYGNQSPGGRGHRNAGRERIWFSPHCLSADTQQEMAL